MNDVNDVNYMNDEKISNEYDINNVSYMIDGNDVNNVNDVCECLLC